ncbi:NusG domain II-containing protein [Rhodobacteraceae bacterium CH30]|nr:NusG domain II-containing protein [Rhodobacteraceae bacterium CH30]
MRLIRPGDYLVMMLAGALCLTLFWQLWAGETARTLTIRSKGKLWREVSLLHNQILDVPGPLGLTRIEVHNGRARIGSDPGARQYCVKQGWLDKAGQSAICLPNQTSIELGNGVAHYDSLSF